MSEEYNSARMETKAYQDYYKKLIGKTALYSTTRKNGDGEKRHRGVIVALEKSLLSGGIVDWSGNVIIEDERDKVRSSVSIEHVKPAPVKGTITWTL